MNHVGAVRSVSSGYLPLAGGDESDYAWLYDWYEMEYTCPANVKDILNALEDGEDVTVIINSGGGDVVSGQEIYSILKGVKNHVTVDVQSMAASAASMIAMAGDTVRMSPVALLMIHNASTCTSGDYRDMQHTAEVLQTVNAAIMEAYSRKTNLTYDELKDMMDRETWLTANQCVEKGFADEIIKDEKPAIITNAMVGKLSITDDMISKAKAEKKLKEEKAAADAAGAEILADLDMYGV